jgi:hypothetical protein
VAFLGPDIVGAVPQFFGPVPQLVALFRHGRLMELPNTYSADDELKIKTLN